MTIQLTAFGSAPSFVQGYVKDLRVRWALEEAGLPYEAVLIAAPGQAGPDYPRWQPFGQVPAYRDDEVELFESGAIVLHIAAKSEALAPKDPAGQARVTAWVIAALNSIEPFAQNWLQLGSAPEAEALRPRLRAILDLRLSALQAWLGDKPYLEGRFTAGDLIMTMVLRELVEDGVLARYPALDDLRRRCEARPAFGRAFEAHMRPFREHAPA
jgi:glutathione S-transferase